jgi:hypothetical protein
MIYLLNGPDGENGKKLIFADNNTKNVTEIAEEWSAVRK